MLGSAFVERIDGDFFNVVGLPVALLCSMLKVCFHTDVFELSNRLTGKIYS
jgi:predicted house-cleaning NTP pyrophosphatase (Maf/HAM1 superfamily)